MWRRPELWLGLALVVVLAIVAIARGTGFDEQWRDQRRSVRLAGPGGAKGLAEVLERLGVPVARRERPLFDLTVDSSGGARGDLLAFLDVYQPTAPEREVVRRYVAGGGQVFVAGYTGIERCFAYRSTPVGASEIVPDSIAVISPAAGLRLAAARRVLARIPVESLVASPGGEAPACPPLFASAVDTLLTTRDGRPVALALRFRGGGRAVVLADSRYVSNRQLKETDAALLVIPWMLAERPRRVVADEYHLGFTHGASLPAAAWHWLWHSPAGWSLLQLLLAGLVWLAVVAVRFGPPRPVIDRRRRSPLEHVEALAAGLEGAGGADAAVGLLVSGLQRRLSRTGHAPRGDPKQWLATLELALSAAGGRQAVRRLQELLANPGGAERVLGTAQAVEDVWEVLRPRATPAGFSKR